MKTVSRLRSLFTVTLLTTIALFAISLIIPLSIRQVDNYWYKVAWSEVLLLIFWLGIFNSSFSSKRNWFGISPSIAVISTTLVGLSFAFLFFVSLRYPHFFPRLYFIIEISAFILATAMVVLLSFAADKARNSSEIIEQENTNLKDIETLLAVTIERLKREFPDQIRISGMLTTLLDNIRHSFILSERAASSGLMTSMFEMTRKLCLCVSDCMDSKDLGTAEADISKQINTIKAIVANVVTRSKSR